MGNELLNQAFLPSGVQPTYSRERVVIGGQSADMTRMSWTSNDGQTSYQGIAIAMDGSSCGDVAGLEIQPENTSAAAQLLRAFANDKEMAGLVLMALILTGNLSVPGGNTTSGGAPLAYPGYLAGPGSTPGNTNPVTPGLPVTPGFNVPPSTGFTPPPANPWQLDAAQSAQSTWDTCRVIADAARANVETSIASLSSLSAEATALAMEASTMVAGKQPNAQLMIERAKAAALRAKEQAAKVRDFMQKAQDASAKVQTAYDNLVMACGNAKLPMPSAVPSYNYAGMMTLFRQLDGNISSLQTSLDGMKVQDPAAPTPAPTPATPPVTATPTTTATTPGTPVVPVPTPATPATPTKPGPEEITPVKQPDADKPAPTTTPTPVTTPVTATTHAAPAQVPARPLTQHVDFLSWFYANFNDYGKTYSGYTTSAEIATAINTWNAQHPENKVDISSFDTEGFRGYGQKPDAPDGTVGKYYVGGYTGNEWDRSEFYNAFYAISQLKDDSGWDSYYITTGDLQIALDKLRSGQPIQ